MFKKDELEQFLYLFSNTHIIPFSNYEDALIDNFRKLDAPFLDFYYPILTGYDNLKNEISENLLALPIDDRSFYLNYLLHNLDSEIFNFDSKEFFELLKHFSIDTENLDFNKNDKLQELIHKSFKSVTRKDELVKLRDFNREYYKYILYSKLDEILKYINELLIMAESKGDFSQKIKWIGNPSQLGFIIGKLAELGYIEAPTHKSGDINYTHFAKLVKSTFECKTTEATLAKYLNLESDKGQETVRKFEDNKLNIPHIKSVS